METTAQVRDALVRIQTEYVEMPQLKLTARQAQRLWSLSSEVWEEALAALLTRRFLIQTPDGGYARGVARRTRIEPLLRAS